MLDLDKAFAGGGSLIPRASKYVAQFRRFEHQCRQAGIHRVHCHRHAYAPERYRELTGWNASAAGGPSAKSLTPEQRAADHEARQVIRRVLGHERPEIANVHLSRQAGYRIPSDARVVHGGRRASPLTHATHVAVGNVP